MAIGISARPQCQDVLALKAAAFGQRGGEFGFYELALKLPAWQGWKPGQFVMLRPRSWGLEPLWGRPFSICRVEEDTLRIFFQVVGRGTARLAAIEQGEYVSDWGPLGNGFLVEPETPTLLLAGGVGIAPFVGYIQEHPRPDNLSFLFGHRCPVGCYPFEFLESRVEAEHFHDQAPGDLEKFLAALERRIEAFTGGLVLACGPKPMLAVVQRLAAKYGARAQISLDNRMACGVGACMGCVCGDGKGGNRLVCQEGPVFWAQDVVIDDE